MLKNRQEGLQILHGVVLVVSAVGLFLGWAQLLQATGWLEFTSTMNLPLYMAGVLIAAFWMQDAARDYSARLGSLDWLSVVRLTRHQLLRVMVVLFSLVFVTKGVEVSRIFIGSYLLLLGVWLTLANMYAPKVVARVFFGGTVLRTVLVAPAEQIPELARWARQHRHLGLHVVGYVGAKAADGGDAGVAWLGHPKALPSVLGEHQIAQVVISQRHFSADECRLFAQWAEFAGCRVRVLFEFGRFFENHPLSVEHDGDNACVTLADEPLDNPVNRLSKRLLDIAVAVPVVTLVMPPLMLMVWWMHRRQSPGPLFHRQYRAGRNRQPFLIYKFRTMHFRPEGGMEAQQAKRNDVRVFAFGRFLRRTSLDEIPQFLNVLIGDMSVSGPRPHLMEHDVEFASVVGSLYHCRHFVKPGITGLAQSMGFRGEIPTPDLLHRRIGYDMIYIKSWSLLLDIKILFQTVRQIVFPPRTAY